VHESEHEVDEVRQPIEGFEEYAQDGQGSTESLDVDHRREDGQLVSDQKIQLNDKEDSSDEAKGDGRDGEDLGDGEIIS